MNDYAIETLNIELYRLKAIQRAQETAIKSVYDSNNDVNNKIDSIEHAIYIIKMFHKGALIRKPNEEKSE